MNRGLQQFLKGAYSRFTSPLLEIGKTPVSVGSIVQLILSILIVIVIVRICKNLLKRRLLVRLGIDEGNREAIATIISYAIGTLGFVIVLQSIGFNLASLAVVAGGLGVGIGFGLKDVIKNFVSGLLVFRLV